MFAAANVELDVLHALPRFSLFLVLKKKKIVPCCYALPKVREVRLDSDALAFVINDSASESVKLSIMLFELGTFSGIHNPKESVESPPVGYPLFIRNSLRTVCPDHLIWSRRSKVYGRLCSERIVGPCIK